MKKMTSRHTLKATLCLLTALLLFLSSGALLPASAAPASQQQNWNGKKLSVLGDSISTFDDYIPFDYNIYYPGSGDIKNVADTWWFQLMNAGGMQLCKNGSSSGTTVAGNSLDTTGSAPGCSFKRVQELTGNDGSVPDLILVFMGVNDFVQDVPLGSFTAPAPQAEGRTATFCAAYELMLQKLKAFYPSAALYVCTPIETNFGEAGHTKDNPVRNRNGNTLMEFNASIKAIAAAYGVPVIDVHECGINYENLFQYTSDGTHPNPSGADLITNAVAKGLGLSR